jgi:hypothetical protein
MITTQHWETLFEWKSGSWDSIGEWTADKLTKELDALEDFRRLKLSKDFKCLFDLVGAIESEQEIRVGNIEYEFKSMKDLFSAWRHFTTNCVNYGQVWVAQDESYTACLNDEKRKCNGLMNTCKEYVPMIKEPVLEEMIKRSSRVEVQFT